MSPSSAGNVPPLYALPPQSSPVDEAYHLTEARMRGGHPSHRSVDVHDLCEPPTYGSISPANQINRGTTIPISPDDAEGSCTADSAIFRNWEAIIDVTHRDASRYQLSASNSTNNPRMKHRVQAQRAHAPLSHLIDSSEACSPSDILSPLSASATMPSTPQLDLIPTPIVTSSANIMSFPAKSSTLSGACTPKIGSPALPLTSTGLIELMSPNAEKSLERTFQRPLREEVMSRAAALLTTKNEQQATLVPNCPPIGQYTHMHSPGNDSPAFGMSFLPENCAWPHRALNSQTCSTSPLASASSSHARTVSWDNAHDERTVRPPSNAGRARGSSVPLQSIFGPSSPQGIKEMTSRTSSNTPIASFMGGILQDGSYAGQISRPLPSRGCLPLSGESVARPPSGSTFLAKQLPLPEEALQLPSTGPSMVSMPSRSTSNDSISSVTNDDGHGTLAADKSSVELFPALPMQDAMDTSLPQLRPRAPSGQLQSILTLAAKSSDPPLIPFPRPKTLSLVQDASIIMRPISPFSPTQALSDQCSVDSAPVQAYLPGDDLINLDSDADSIIATPGLQNSHQRLNYKRYESHLSVAHADGTEYDSGDDLDIIPPIAGPSSARLLGTRVSHASRESLYERNKNYRYDYAEDEDDDADDLDKHPLYAALSTARTPYLRQAWEEAAVVLVPPRHTLPLQFLRLCMSPLQPPAKHATLSLSPRLMPTEWESWAAMHTLSYSSASMKDKSDLVSYGASENGMRLRLQLSTGSNSVSVQLCADHQVNSEIRSRIASATAQGMLLPLSSANDDMRRSSSNVSSASQAASLTALPPHLVVSSSPTSTNDSSMFPSTPPLSDFTQSLSHVRSLSCSFDTLPPQSLSPDLLNGNMYERAFKFPSIDTVVPPSPGVFKHTFDADLSPMSPTRNLQIVSEQSQWRKRRLSSTSMSVSSSAPMALPPLHASGGQSPRPGTHRLSSQSSISSISSVMLNKPQPPLPAGAVPPVVKKKPSKVRLRLSSWIQRQTGNNRDSLSPLTPSSSMTSIASTISKSEIPPASAPPIGEIFRSKRLNNRASTMSMASTLHAPLPTIAQEPRPFERLRILRLDNYVVEWPGQQPHASSVTRPFRANCDNSFVGQVDLSASTASGSVSASACVSAPTHEGSTLSTRQNSNASSKYSRSKRASGLYKHSNASDSSSIAEAAPSSGSGRRDFAADIAYLLEPPKQHAHLAGVLQDVLRDVIALTKELGDELLLEKARTTRIVERIQREIFDHAWAHLEQCEMPRSLKDRLNDTIENAILAFMHDYLYEKTLKPLLSRNDAVLSEIISVYRSSSITMNDFGIGSLSYMGFDAEVKRLSHLAEGEATRQELWEKMPPSSYKRLNQIISETTDSASTVISLLEARTPLDCAGQFRWIIQDLVKSAEMQQKSDSKSSLATDDLIPLLAWLIVQAAPSSFYSLVHYVRHYRLWSNNHQGDLEWATVQFEAAVAYVCTDPLKLANIEMPSPPLSPTHSPAPSINVFQPLPDAGSVNEADLVERLRRASMRSFNSEQKRPAHKRAASALPTTRIVTYQKPDKRMSIISTVTTEEESDGSSLSVPPPHQRPGSTSSTDDNHRPEVPMLMNARHRAMSSYSLASTELQIRPSIARPPSFKPIPRSYHVAQDLVETDAQPTRIPLFRSQTSSVAEKAQVKQLPATDLHRSGSDGSRRGSVDWYNPMRFMNAAPPVSPDAVSLFNGGLASPGHLRSSRPLPAASTVDAADSQRSSLDIERGVTDMSWFEWSRKRLSSMTSLASIVDTSSPASGPVAAQVAARLAAVRDDQVFAGYRRPRRMSESAANVSGIAEAGDETFVDHAPDDAIDEAYEGKRNQSTVSLVSMLSNETESSTGFQPSSSSTTSAASRLGSPALWQSLGAYVKTGPTVPARSRKHRSRAAAAPPQLRLDTVLATSLSKQLHDYVDHTVSAGSTIAASDMFPTAGSINPSLAQPPHIPLYGEMETFTLRKLSPSLDYDTSVPPTPRENSFIPILDNTPRFALSASATVKTLKDLI